MATITTAAETKTRITDITAAADIANFDTQAKLIALLNTEGFSADVEAGVIRIKKVNGLGINFNPATKVLKVTKPTFDAATLEDYLLILAYLVVWEATAQAA